MTDEKNKTGLQFDGLPMQSLIGSPLKAASDAQAKLAETTAGIHPDSRVGEFLFR